MRELTKAEYRRLKSNLTRAINSGDPLKVLATCREARDAFDQCYWPDDWSRWSRAYEDAIHKARMDGIDW